MLRFITSPFSIAVSTHKTASPQVLIKLALTLGIILLSNFSLALTPGSSAPDFTLPRLDSAADTQLSLSDYRGKIIYLDFWASWCGPCRKSLPALDQLRSELNHPQFEVIAISLDDEKQAALDFLQQYPIRYPSVINADSSLAPLYNVRGMPTSFLIDDQGKVIHVHQGFKTADIAKIRQQVTQALSKLKRKLK